jgi:thiamine pyrophosphokinase
LDQIRAVSQRKTNFGEKRESDFAALLYILGRRFEEVDIYDAFGSITDHFLARYYLVGKLAIEEIVEDNKE